MKRFIKNKQLYIGLFLVSLVVLSAIFAPYIAPYDPVKDADLMNTLQPPGGNYLLGTDTHGRDLLSRIIYGGRISLLIGIIAQTINTIIGVSLGLMAGIYGGKTDNIIMGLTNIMLSMPGIILALAIMVILGPGLINLLIAMGLTMWTYTCRLTRAQTLSIKKKEYIEAAKAMGASKLRIVLKYILPNISGPILVVATLGAAEAILMEASLSFLGLGVQPPSPSWGTMMSGGREFIWIAPWLMLYPGIALLITVLGLNIFGDGLRDILDPQSQIN